MKLQQLILEKDKEILEMEEDLHKATEEDKSSEFPSEQISANETPQR